MASVTLDKIQKVYDNGFVAVHESTFQVQNGEFVVLVGPSGCGKSTTLRMVAGLEDISSGTLQIGERVVNDVPPKDRDIAMVFQNYALYPHMSVFDNMAFGLKLRKFDKGEIKKRVEQAADILELTQVLDNKPKQLSGGQRQRVALGRAIVRKPAVFLFDEPLSNLDAKLRVQMRTEIAKLHRQLAATTVYVTHDQVEAMTMGDRIVVMNKGSIQQIAPPLVLYDHPVNKFVAGFIGSPSMNFVTGEIVRDSAGLMFKSPTLSLPVGAAAAGMLASYAGKAVIMGIRPEDLYVAGHVPAAKETATATLRLDVTEPMGNEVFLHASAQNGPLIVARVVPQPLPPTGDPITLAFDLGKQHFFDAQTEVALVKTPAAATA